MNLDPVKVCRCELAFIVNVARKRAIPVDSENTTISCYDRRGGLGRLRAARIVNLEHTAIAKTDPADRIAVSVSEVDAAPIQGRSPQLRACRMAERQSACV